MTYSNIKTEKKDGSSVEISGELTSEAFEKFRAPALKQLGENAKIDGFRPGHIPEDVLIKHVGEANILHQMAELALREHYPILLMQEKIDAIGSPEISITKIAAGNPLGFKITTAVMPEITLPDYAKVAKAEMAKKADFAVEEKEVEEAIEHIRKMSVGEVTKENKDQEPPELTDELVKKIGDFKDVADFKAKVKESLVKEKEHRAKEEKRVAIMETLIKETKGDIPAPLTEGELHKMLAQFKDRLTQMKKTYEDYLKEAKKTEEDIHNELKPEAERRAKLNLILFEIAKKEAIKPDSERVEKEVKHILEHHKDASEPHVRAYVENVLTNEAVFNWLEGQK